MKMIKLTNHQNGRELFISADHLVGMSRLDSVKTLVLSSGGGTDHVTETPEQILKLLGLNDQPVDAFAGLGDDPHGDDFLAFDEIDEMLASGELILGRTLQLPSNPDMIKDLVVGGRVQRPDTVAIVAGLVAITIYGTPEELAGIQAGDYVHLIKADAPPVAPEEAAMGAIKARGGVGFAPGRPDVVPGPPDAPRIPPQPVG